MRKPKNQMTSAEFRSLFNKAADKITAPEVVLASSKPDLFVKRRNLFIGGKEPANEKQVQKLLSMYVQTYYPQAEFHVDLAGSNLSTAQAGQAKSVQKRRGWQDFRLYEWSGETYCALFLELKKKYTGRGERVKLHKANGTWKTVHLMEQFDCILRMRKRRRASGFVIGAYEALQAVDYYLGEDYERLITLLTQNDKS